MTLLILPCASAMAVRECKPHQQKPFSLQEYFQRQRSRMTWPSQGLLEDFGQRVFPEKKSWEVHRDENRVSFPACDTTLAESLELGFPAAPSELSRLMQEFICLQPPHAGCLGGTWE